MKKGHRLKLLLLLLSLHALLYGCAVDSRSPVSDAKPVEVQLEPDALLAASRSTTANRLLKEVLQVDDARDLCEGLVTHNKRLPIIRYRKPPYLRFYRDSTFNTRAIRITDSAFGEVHKPVYSSIQAWNADESLLLLHRHVADKDDYVLLDGYSYQLLKSLDIPTSNVRHLFWSHTDKDTLFYVSRGTENQGWFMRYNVRTDTSQRIRRFDDICGSSVPDWGNNSQMQSLDNDLFGFRCETPTGHARFSYRVSTDAIALAASDQDSDWDSDYAPMPAPSGLRMELQGRVLTPDLEHQLKSLDQANYKENSSLGRTSADADALYQTTFDASPDGCNGSEYDGVAHLTEYNLESGNCRAVISQADGWPYTTSGTHVSAVARHRPGWVAMSSIGYTDLAYLAGRSKAPALTSEIYLVNADSKQSKLCRLAQHRTFAREALNGGYPAKLGEPHVTLSPSGTRLLFGSDWYDSGSVDSYVVELKAYTDLKKVSQ